MQGNKRGLNSVAREDTEVTQEVSLNARKL